MSDQLEQIQANIVAAVQQELSRFSREVDTVVKQIREELAAGTTARTQLEGQVRTLASALEKSHNANTTFQAGIQVALEERLNEFSESTKRRHDEMNTRLGRVVDEANIGIASAVQSAARPVVRELEHRQDRVEADIKSLDGSIRKFDEQAGQLVNHVNSVTSAIEGRLDQASRAVLTSFDERHAALVLRLDEVSAVAARQQSEVGNLVGAKVDASETRVNERMVGLEARITDEVGQRVADIDAHVGRVGAGLDDAVVTLNDRIAKADGRFAAVEAEFATIRADLENIDADAIDEMKDKIGSALGQAELVRIEVERFQVSVAESLDKSAVRITELETTVQDQSMDVETAVQLERLEEVERAVLMLDPDQFVRRDEAGSLVGGISGSADVEPEVFAEEPDTMALLAAMDAAGSLKADPVAEPPAAPAAPMAPPPPATSSNEAVSDGDDDATMMLTRPPVSH